MPVNPGARLGPYEITAPIGAGGMGEVFRARDTKLGRDVAIKVLPAAFAQDPERLARFEREARVLASLNHTNIAHVYGFESGALPDGSTAHFLAMEMVEGEDLAERLKRGAIPTDEAIAMARQIAEGLEEAHDRGIIHRDLKPANVKLTPDGKVKVLDFGLAKAIEGEPGAGGAGSQLSHSPTISRHMTEAGVIMGTAAYMSPEQARGRAVDKRADIWAFGVVLFEMLTGERLFAGESVAETLGLIFSREPDLAKLGADTPPPVRALIARCLVKDPRRRLRDIGEARLVLEGGADAPGAPERKPRRAVSWIWPAIAAISLTMAALAPWNRPLVDKTQTRFSIPLPPGQELTSYPAITRDGRTLAWVAQEGGGDSQLYLRDLNAFEARPVSGARGAKQPFFSPDGRWVAFFAQGQLQKAEVAGGAPIRLADAAYSFGGTWSEDDTIIYTTSLGSGLWRIPASGGTPESLTVPDGAANGYAHVYPQALPGGRRLLFTAWGQNQGAAVLSLDSRKWDLVLPEASFGAAVFDPGRGASPRLLMIDQAGGMRAAGFDPRNPARTSAEGSVLSDVYHQVETDTLGWLAVSNTGAAVYATGNPGKTSLVWVDREGRADPLSAEQDAYREVNLSPDGTAAVVRHRLSLWTHDLTRGTKSPLTSGNSNNNLALWSRDGRRIIFGSTRGGDWDLYTQPADGSGPAEILVKRPFDQFPYSILPDGTLLFVEIHPRTGRDLWTASPDGKVSPLRVTPSNEFNAHFSPGPMGVPHSVAYSSEESGRSEIYVQSFPGGERRVPVSTSGGILPAWSPDGKELFYVTGDSMMAAAMRPDGSVGASRRLFDRSRFLFNDRFRSYAVSPDGKRFLMIRRDPGSIPNQLNVILNWTAESKQTAARDGGN